jgi:hypothetical protein
VAAFLALLACADQGGGPSGGPGAGAVPAGNVTTPFPIDAADRPGAPQTYKGLPLRLTETGAPFVTPADGRVGFVCVGMSNAQQECSDFIGKARTSWAAEVSPLVRLVSCAVGGHAIERWNDPAFDGVLWRACVVDKLPAAGLRADQVRVLYHKAADQFGDGRTSYPDPASDYFAFRANLTRFAERALAFFPALQAVYTTSRSYGGFADNPGRGEPLSYEEGHALNSWLGEHPGVGAVWFGWGPYIWAPACGSGTTNGSGVCYERADYQDDGVHPAAGARDKISALMHARFRQHSWYRR